MFLYKFDKKQQMIFLGLAEELIKADKIISQNEKKIFDGFKSEIGHSDVEKDLSEECVSKFFQSKEAKAVLMLELLGIAICDGEISEEEKKMILNLQKILKIDDNQMKEYFDWVNQLTELYSRAFSYFK